MMSAAMPGGMAPGRTKMLVFLLPSMVILVLAFLPDLSNHLAFKRDAIQGGAWWRLVTGNFVHFTYYHAVMNALGLGAFSCLLFAGMPLSRWLISFLMVNLAVGLGLFIFDTELYEYRGMSGAIYGVLAAGLVLTLTRRSWINGLVLVGLTGKLVYEQLPAFDANYLLAQVGAPVAANAHLFGAVTGAVVGLLARLYNARLSRRDAKGQ